MIKPLKRFLQLAIQHGKEMQAGSENANKTHVALMKLKPELLQSNQGFLEESCHHKDPSTRIWSATFIASFNKRLAESTLAMIKKNEMGYLNQMQRLSYILYTKVCYNVDLTAFLKFEK